MVFGFFDGGFFHGAVGVAPKISTKNRTLVGAAATLTLPRASGMPAPEKRLPLSQRVLGKSKSLIIIYLLEILAIFFPPK